MSIERKGPQKFCEYHKSIGHRQMHPTEEGYQETYPIRTLEEICSEGCKNSTRSYKSQDESDIPTDEWASMVHVYGPLISSPSSGF